MTAPLRSRAVARRNPRLQRLARHLHAAGPRPMFEALIAVDGGQPLDEVLENFGRIPIRIYRAVGADELHVDTPTIIHGGRR